MSDTNKKGADQNEFFRLATEKRQTSYRNPELKKQLLVVSKKYKLLGALDKIAREEGAQLRHARPDTPDICVFSASVRVVDRHYLARKTGIFTASSWRT